MESKNYYQFDASIDPKLIGRSKLPLTVQIKNKVFHDQSVRYFVDVQEYFKDRDILIQNFPKDLKGKMYQRKKSPIDLMNVMPHYISINFAITEKVKKILDGLKIDPKEQYFEEFAMEGYSEKFYFWFVPMLKNSEYVDFEKTIFYDGLNNVYKVFETYKNYMELRTSGNFSAKTLFVSSELNNRDIISLQAGGPFYSERIIDAFKKEDVVGFEMIERGYAKKELHFTDL
ncbi:hypothetical protein SAMN05443633_11242 [Chryseobacterium arachidis]|uniref:Uncharacterized protein n=1 Tax=Chryseobacterium arachidis TaxID=1416778 RepID=A0A1M5I8P1_9FLAO|nr:hypothetical protein [Chryseobacterium arachidis]SHG24622.1 hypothetical protein SAMN05443633_11242 [Chryseobacterium arachidis]